MPIIIPGSAAGGSLADNVVPSAGEYIAAGATVLAADTLQPFYNGTGNLVKLTGNDAAALTAAGFTPKFGEPVTNISAYLKANGTVRKGLHIAPHASASFSVTSGSLTYLDEASDPDAVFVENYNSSDPVTFDTYKRDALVAAAQTIVDVANYDNAGTISAAIQVGIWEVYASKTENKFALLYPQETYSDIVTAKKAVANYSPVKPAALAGWVLLSRFVAVADATDFTNANQAEFYATNQFGELSGSVGGSSANDRIFISDTALSPAVAAKPTVAEVQSYASPKNIKDALLYYTGTDTDTDTVTYVYNADASGIITHLAGGEKNIYDIDGVINENREVDLKGNSLVLKTDNGSAGFENGGWDSDFYVLKQHATVFATGTPVDIDIQKQMHLLQLTNSSTGDATINAAVGGSSDNRLAILLENTDTLSRNVIFVAGWKDYNGKDDLGQVTLAPSEKRRIEFISPAAQENYVKVADTSGFKPGIKEIHVDASNTTFEETLPAATGSNAARLYILVSSANGATLAPALGETLAPGAVNDKFSFATFTNGTRFLVTDREPGIWDVSSLGSAVETSKALRGAVFSLSTDTSGIIIPWDRVQGDTSAFINTNGVITIPAGNYRIKAYATRAGAPADYELYDVTNSKSLGAFSTDTAGAAGSNMPVYLDITSDTQICVREGKGDASIIWNGREDGFTNFPDATKPWGCFLDIQERPQIRSVVQERLLSPEQLAYGKLFQTADQTITFSSADATEIPFSQTAYASNITVAGNGFTVANAGRYEVSADILMDDITLDGIIRVFVDGAEKYSEIKNLRSGYNSFSFSYDNLTVGVGAFVKLVWTPIGANDDVSILKGTSFTLKQAPVNTIILTNKDVQITGGHGSNKQELISNGDGTASFMSKIVEILNSGNNGQHLLSNGNGTARFVDKFYLEEDSGALSGRLVLGNTLIQWGIVPSQIADTNTVFFGRNYPDSNYAVFVNSLYDPGAATVGCSARNRQPSYFTFVSSYGTVDQSTGNVEGHPVCWLAVGRAT